MSKDIISGANINKAGVYPGWKMKKQAPGPGPEPVDDTFPVAIEISWSEEDQIFVVDSVDQEVTDIVAAIEAGKTIVPDITMDGYGIGDDNFFAPYGVRSRISEISDLLVEINALVMYIDDILSQSENDCVLTLAIYYYNGESPYVEKGWKCDAIPRYFYYSEG